MITYIVKTNTIEKAFKTLSDDFIKSIEVLKCDKNSISDLSLLRYCPLLKVLYCYGTKVSDLSPLRYCPLLKELYCNSSSVSDLSPLQHCPSLKELYCSYTKVSDLSPLQYCPLLEILHCSYTKVSDLSPLQHCPLLKELYCFTTAITDLAPLQHCPLLKLLYCSDTKVSDLSPLQYCSLLEILYCSDTKVSDLSPLQYCSLLEILFCSSSIVSDLSPLIHCTHLSHISHIGCPIEFIPVQIQRIIERNRRAEINVYNDSQSVHNHSIQQSLIKSVNYLSNKFSANLIKAKTDIIIPECLRSGEIHVVLNITLSDCYQLVHSRILKFDNEEVQKELFKRLEEEVKDGESMCFTGKFTRLVNTLVGFDDNIRLDISQNEQISAIILNEKDKLNPYDKEKHINAVKTLLNELNIDKKTQDEWINEI